MTRTLAEIEAAAKSANINMVAAWIKENGNDYDRCTIQALKESLMEAYIESVRGQEMDEFIFNNIGRIADL